MDALQQLIAEREQYISLCRILLSAVEENSETLLRAKSTLDEEGYDEPEGVGMITDINYQLEDNDSVVIRARKQLVHFPS